MNTSVNTKSNITYLTSLAYYIFGGGGMQFFLAILAELPTNSEIS